MSSKNMKRPKMEPRKHYKEGIPRKGPNLRHAALCQLGEMEPMQIFKNMTASTQTSVRADNGCYYCTATLNAFPGYGALNSASAIKISLL